MMPAMETPTEEGPDRAAVEAYLAKHRLRRLPWGTLVAGGHLTYARSVSERTRRCDMGEVALALLAAQGVSLASLNALVETTPWDATGDQLVAQLSEMHAPAGGQGGRVDEEMEPCADPVVLDAAL